MVQSRQCTNCGSYQQTILKDPVLVVCRKCGGFIVDNTRARPALQPAPMPQDWTFIQIGTTGFFDNEQFAVIGRVRLQLLNEYKNIWTIVTQGGTTLLLTESFASFSVFRPDFIEFDSGQEKLRAGKPVPVRGQGKFYGEYLEKCIEIHCEGEIDGWRNFVTKFFMLQCADVSRNTALVPFEPGKPTYYILGKKVTLKDLKLSNIITWDEWK